MCKILVLVAFRSDHSVHRRSLGHTTPDGPEVSRKGLTPVLLSAQTSTRNPATLEPLDPNASRTHFLPPLAGLAINLGPVQVGSGGFLWGLSGVKLKGPPPPPSYLLRALKQKARRARVEGRGFGRFLFGLCVCALELKACILHG